MLETTPGTTEEQVVAQLCRAGVAAAVAGSLLTVLWIVTMAAFPAAPGSTAAEHLAYLAANDVKASLMFVVVLPLGLVFVPVWIAVAARAWRAHPVAASLSVVFGLMYAPLSTSAYWLQLVSARGLADAYRTDPSAATAYQLLDFGASSSMAAAFDLLGYSVLGLGTIAACLLLWSDGRLGRLAGSMFALSGALSIVGAVGAVLRWPVLEAGVIAAGLPFLVAMVAAIPILHASRRGRLRQN